MGPVLGPPTFEHHREALGIGEAQPRLSWKTKAGAGWSQVAYELRVTRGPQEFLTGRVPPAESVLVPWPGQRLTSREQASVRVRVWGDDAEPSRWSAPATV